MFKKLALRATLLAVLILAGVMTLGGCYFGDPFMEDSSFYDSEYKTDRRESVSEGFFKLTIHTDKDEFAKGEAIDCWAELEYIGEQASITVYCYGNPIQMEMTNDDVYYSSTSGYQMKSAPLILQKGKPIRVTLAESLPKSTSVLPGTYQIDAYSNLNLSTDDAVSYNANVSAVIVVI